MNITVIHNFVVEISGDAIKLQPWTIFCATLRRPKLMHMLIKLFILEFIYILCGSVAKKGSGCKLKHVLGRLSDTLFTLM